MNLKQLGEELMYYAQQLNEGKDLEINFIEIRNKIDYLNSLIDDAEGDDFHKLVGICYQYYRLLYF